MYTGDILDVTQLSPEDLATLEEVVDQLEFLGILVHHRLIDADVVTTFFRYSPRRVWHIAGPFIQATRRHAPGYGTYLEKLAGAPSGSQRTPQA